MANFKQPPRGICIHHSATPDGAHADTEAIRRYHVETNGWDDIGYHYLVERVDGEVKIIPGRPETIIGAHCPALNRTHLGICLVGNYDLQPPDSQLLFVLEGLCHRLMLSYQIPLKGIVFHNDYSDKSCPGDQFPYGGFLLALAGEDRP